MFSIYNFVPKIDSSEHFTTVRTAKQLKAIGFPQETIHYIDIGTKTIYSTLSKVHREELAALDTNVLVALPTAEEILVEMYKRQKDLGEFHIHLGQKRKAFTASNSPLFSEVFLPKNLTELLAEAYLLSCDNFDEFVKSHPDFSNYQ